MGDVGHSDGVSRIRTAGGASEIGRRLRAARQRLGWSQEKLGEASELGRLKIVHIEGGRNNAGSVAVRDGLAAAFGAPAEVVSKFLFGEFEGPEAAAEWLLSQRTYHSRLEVGPIWRVAAAANGDDPDDPAVARAYETVFSAMLKAAADAAHAQVRMQAEAQEKDAT